MINQINEQIGTRAEGGGLGRGGSGTVLPPPPTPIPGSFSPLPEKTQEELEAEWAADPTNPVNKRKALDPVVQPIPAPAQHRKPFFMGAPELVVIEEAVLVLDDGSRIDIPKEDVLRLKAWAVDICIRHHAVQFDSMRKHLIERFGLGAINENVQQVSGGAAEGSVQEAPKGVSDVREPILSEAAEGRPLPSDVEAQSQGTGEAGSPEEGRRESGEGSV